MSYRDKAREYVQSLDFASSTGQAYIKGFAEWLDQQAAQEAMAKPAPQSHSCPCPSSEGDEYVCYAPGCGLRWDAHEEKPPCRLA